MKISCPACNQEYDIELDQLGKNAECEACKENFTLKNPNLITCPICFKDISKEAETCVHCGHPLKEKIPKEVHTKITLPHRSQTEDFEDISENQLNYILKLAPTGDKNRLSNLGKWQASMVIDQLKPLSNHGDTLVVIDEIVTSQSVKYKESEFFHHYMSNEKDWDDDDNVSILSNNNDIKQSKQNILTKNYGCADLIKWIITAVIIFYIIGFILWLIGTK